MITTLAPTIHPVMGQVAGGSPKQTVTGGPLPAGVTPSASVDTIAYLSVSPNPIGVGQTALINIWLQPAVHVTRAQSGFTVTLTKPDGTVDTVGPMNSYQGDTTAWFNYVVDQVGTWKIKFSFAGNYFPAGYYLQGLVYDTPVAGSTYLGSAYYKPSATKDVELTVQQQPVMSWPWSALPTGYWTRPITPENREWYVIGGNYPFSGQGGGPDWPADTNTYASNYKFTPYVQAPNTAHILWKRQGSLAGIIGGQFGSMIIGSGEGGYAGTPSVIFQGRAYQAITKPMMQTVNGTEQSVATSVLECYDLRTGEVYWDLTNVPAPTGIDTSFRTPVVPGATQSSAGVTPPQLIVISNGRLIRIDPFTGAIALNMSTSPLTSATYYSNELALSVQTIGTGANTKYYLVNWTTAGTATDLKSRIVSNITFPFSSLGACDFEAGVSVTTISISPNATGVSTDVYIQAASLTTGNLLWNISSGVGYPIFSGSTACADHGKFAVRFDNGFWYCWDSSSGKQLWKSEAASWPWGVFGAYTTASAYGLLYDFTYAGLYAIDWDTGKIAWHFEAPCRPFESPWYPSMAFFGANPQIADGKLFISNGEHSPTSPLARGWTMYAVNATTGQQIWNITSRGNAGAIADGYLTFDSVYTGYLYVAGKGLSATTVTANPAIVSQGATMIQGTVLDQSLAQPDTPCVSKDSMTAQMEYLHFQHPIDGLDHNLTITGVPVTLTALDSNGNYENIGTVTTDGYYGTFSKSWTPPIEGDYKIIASFAGDDSYGVSSATTAISVAKTPTATSTTVPLQAIPDYTMTIVAGVIAVIIAVAVVGALLMITLRKKQ